MSLTLVLDITPREAAAVATIVVDGTPVVGHRLELPAPRRARVSVTAVGYHRFSELVDVDKDMVLPIALVRRPHKKNRTLPVTLGMGAVSVLAWLVRRR